MSFKFEQLRAWQNTLDISFEIQQITKKILKEEWCILTSQIKRATDSICLNIAEGYTLHSAIEVICCRHIAKKHELLDEDTFQRLYKK